MADPLLLPGATHPAVVTLRALLADQLPEAAYSVAVPQVYDAKLVEHVLKYQKLKGLVVDGKVGVNTWAALRGIKPLTVSNVSNAVNAEEGSGDVPLGPMPQQKDNTMMIVLGAAAAAVALYLWG